MNDFSQEKAFLKKYWPYLTIFFAPPLIKFLGGEDVSRDLVIRFVFIVVALLAYFIGIKVLRLNKKEELPLYGSPVIWLGVPLLGVMVYEFLF